MLKDKEFLIETDSQGYLKDSNTWNKSVAVFLAKKENIILNEYHWEIIFFIRDFYLEFGISPKIRMLIRLLYKKYGKKIGNIFYLYSLFPNGPQKQAIKIAGLPRSNICI